MLINENIDNLFRRAKNIFSSYWTDMMETAASSDAQSFEYVGYWPESPVRMKIGGKPFELAVCAETRKDDDGPAGRCREMSPPNGIKLFIIELFPIMDPDEPCEQQLANQKSFLEHLFVHEFAHLIQLLHGNKKALFHIPKLQTLPQFATSGERQAYLAEIFFDFERHVKSLGLPYFQKIASRSESIIGTLSSEFRYYAQLHDFPGYDVAVQQNRKTLNKYLRNLAGKIMKAIKETP